ncbi:MAG: PQQ-binding-like beta-propeller repeat protein [Acidobacteria bacterium]|nr:PQQ-binding-like beta-propeller repeat protein [Acidobacteriota bacterium]
MKFQPVGTVVLALLCAIAAGGTSTAGQSLDATGRSDTPVRPPRPNAAPDSTWASYGNDPGNQRYVPFDQITAANFEELEVAWRFKTENFGSRPEYRFESTPLVIDGILYTTAGSRRAVVALDAVTGEVLWTYREDEGQRGRNAPRQLSGRGLAHWTDGTESRIVYVTPGYRMIALDAKTGRRVPGFGKDGVVDLKTDFDQDIDPITADVGLQSTPAIANNIIIIGAAHSQGTSPTRISNVKGYVRGFDARTGERRWIFHTIPKPGQFGYDSWENGSADRAANTGLWTQISIDPDLDMAYLPVELPTGDFYGGHRPGNGLFGESLVAVDLQTGERKWHFQLVHHGLWDSDIACAPMLVDITVGGRSIKAVAQLTKMGFTYVFDRVTGEPVWPIVETPVAKGDVPGEWYSPTQPIPSRPAPFDRQGVSADDLIDFTPALRAEALAAMSAYRTGPIFTPPSLMDLNGTFGTLMLPHNQGGANWPGGSFDPETRTLYVYSQTQLANIGLIPGNPAVTDFPYTGRTAPLPPGPAPNRGGMTVQGLSIIKPPYGRITAINLDRGDIVWQVPHGDTPDAIRNNPVLKGLTIPRTGQPGMAGTLVTKTLVIAGETQFSTAGHPRGALLRAYDKATGADAGAVLMPAPQTGSPMSYMLGGRQYIVVAVAGTGFPGELIAYVLPD